MTDNYKKYTKRNPFRKLILGGFHAKVEMIIGNLGVSSVLDAGCGEGFTLSRLQARMPTKRFEGLEYSESAISLAKTIHSDIAITRGDVYAMPYVDDAFDLVLCFEVLEHLDNPARALRELKRVARRYCLITVPNEPYFQMIHLLAGKNIRRWGNDRGHVQHWSMNGIRKLMETEFEVLEVRIAALFWTVVLVVKLLILGC